MRAKKLLTSRQIFRYAVPARTVTKKHCCYYYCDFTGLQTSRPSIKTAEFWTKWNCTGHFRYRGSIEYRYTWDGIGIVAPISGIAQHYCIPVIDFQFPLPILFYVFTAIAEEFTSCKYLAGEQNRTIIRTIGIYLFFVCMIHTNITTQSSWVLYRYMIFRFLDALSNTMAEKL